MLKNETKKSVELVVFISGFTQTTKKVNGVSELFKWAWRERRVVGAEGYRIELYTWRANWEAVAEYCYRVLGVERVFICAYSWGVGWGAVELSKYLQNLGIKVGWLISCDGVYRWGKLSIARANPLNFRTLIHRGPFAPKIKISSNVAEVYPLRQYNGRLKGHDFIRINPERTRLHDTIRLTVPHDKIDDSLEFKSLVQRKLTDLWRV